MKHYIKKHLLQNGDDISKMGLALHQMTQNQSSIEIFELYRLSNEIKKVVDKTVEQYCKKNNLFY